MDNFRLAPGIVFKSHSPKSTNTDNCKTREPLTFKYLETKHALPLYVMPVTASSALWNPMTVKININ